MARGCWAPDYPHALQAAQYDTWRRRLVAEWGGPAGIETFAPSISRDPQGRAWWAGLLRAASSPGGISAVLEALRDTDVRHLLPQLSVPTLVLHRRDDLAVRVAAGRDMASRSRAQIRRTRRQGSLVLCGRTATGASGHQRIYRRLAAREEANVAATCGADASVQFGEADACACERRLVPSHQ